MQKDDKWENQIGFYRFLANKKVTEEKLIECVKNNCAEQCKDVKEVLLIEDSSEMNLEKHRNRITNFDGLGTVGNGTDLGFFVHPTIAVNPCDKSFMGAIDLHFWDRAEVDADAGIEVENQDSKKKKKDRAFEVKESYRWTERAITARERLSATEKVVIVQDREGDIYESFYALKERNVDFVIRLHYNRKIVDVDGQKDKLKNHIGKLSPVHEYEFEMNYLAPKGEVSTLFLFHTKKDQKQSCRSIGNGCTCGVTTMYIKR
jgi:hypothetical protein